MNPAVVGMPVLLDCAAGMREGGGAAEMPVPNVLLSEVETELAAAARHVAQARVIVAQQRERVARLKAHGSCTRDHELTLDVFISTLESLEHHERALRASAAKLNPARRLPS